MVDPPSKKFYVGCTWVYTIWNHSDGSVEHYNGYLIDKGFKYMGVRY